ncbi:MAG: hypothetical protein DI535_10665 [Citrobacter freundii]|nr:MAG: hypothetical protein DI535_10665 [Citrobacter freundii]
MELKFFSINDLILVPLCYFFLWIILRSRAKRRSDPRERKLYYKAFYFKMLSVLVFTLITEFYFGGGDTNLYYQGAKDLRQAIGDDVEFVGNIVRSSSLSTDNPLSTYFLYDNYAYDITYNYMKSPGNFFMPRLAVIPGLIFFNSYLCIAMCFAFFALGGALRLFKVFHYYYPSSSRELAIATLFLPSVSFWSSGLLKDTICFGCVGFILYAVFSIRALKKNIGISAGIIAVCSYLLFMIKTYIFLVLLMTIAVWIFREMSQLIKKKSLRGAFTVITLTIGITVSFFLVRYFTSQETLQQYQFENIASSAQNQRSNYASVDQSMGGGSSYFQVNTSNTFLLVLGSISATFYRPFPWEVTSAAAALSAVESMLFLFATLYLFLRQGLLKPFGVIFGDPRLFMCFVFAMVFAIGVGASTANFGALSRYKIPCLPFYMIMVMITYRKLSLPYPAWLSKALGLLKI